MDLVIVTLVIGGVLIFGGALMILVRAFQESVWWGLACLLVPCAKLVFCICHWARMKWYVFGMLIGFGVILFGLLTTEKSNREDIERLSISIEEKRTRIESLEEKFQVKGADLAKQFQQLDKRRKELKANDAAEVQRFNVEAEAYSSENKAHQAIGAELESARKELTGLLDERARIRPLGRG